MYTCPMHPKVIKESGGMCPICGMNLIPTKHSASEHKVHDKHEGHHTESFLKKFYITLALTIPILLYSDIFHTVLDWNMPKFIGLDFFILILGTIIYFYGGGVFLVSAYREIKAKLPGMMTLIAIAITAAYLYSVYTTFAGGMNLFWELATLIAVMLLGHYVEMRAVQGAKGALKELAKLLPDTAEVIRNGETYVITLVELRAGDVVMVRPGGKVPADGKIIDGQSEMDESIITGESKPVTKAVGQEVIAGSINGDGTIKIEVLNIGEKTFLAGIMRLVAEAESSKSRLQILSDRAALWLTILAVVAGVVTFIVWLLVGKSFSFAIERVVAVLVIACPHALGLAVPLVASISTTMGAKNGLLIRKRLSLEEARKINVVLFDKTGTLTEAKFKVISFSSTLALELAASVNSQSEHPIAKAIVEEAEKQSLQINNVSNFSRVPGRGAEGFIGQDKIFVGTKGEDEIVVEKNGKIVGTIEVADHVRPESKVAINDLKKLGLQVMMITGDSQSTANKVADVLGLDQFFARVLPEDKVKKVKELQEKGMRVAMVGDGVNDAPALTQADLGIAIGGGTNVAIESAGIILIKNDPREIVKIIKLSKLTYRKMVQNLFWATGYNVLALPVAAGVLYSKGVMLNPAVAAVFMSLSTVIVSINAVLLRKEKLY